MYSGKKWARGKKKKKRKKKKEQDPSPVPDSSELLEETA